MSEMAETDIIKDMSLALLELRQTEEGLLCDMQNIKTICILEVESEWESTKDKTLSNATKRGVEVELRLSNDNEYIIASMQQDRIHKTIRRDQIELDFQQREFQRQMRE